MSAWEVFCAICGGSSTSYAEVGSRDPEALKRRREEVRKQQQKMEEGRLYQYFHDLGIADPRDNEVEDEDGGGSVDSGYDPTLVAEDTSWLHSMRCLGLTEDESGDGKSVSFAVLLRALILNGRPQSMDFRQRTNLGFYVFSVLFCSFIRIYWF